MSQKILRQQLQVAESRVKDLEAMLEALSGRYEGSCFRWEAWDFGLEGTHTRKINLPSKGRLYIELGKDRYGRMMRLEIAPAACPDGTQGVRITGEHLLRNLSSGACNVIYVTEQDPRDLVDPNNQE